MAKFISALFFDKLRGIASLLLLVIIAALLLMGQFFPKPVSLDSNTTETFVRAADVMRQAANSMESTVKDYENFRQSLRQELSVQAELRRTNYATLYDQYGIGSMPDPAGAAIGSLNLGLRQPSYSEGSRSLPPDKDDPGRAEQLQHATSNSGNATGGSNTGAPGGGSQPPSEQGGAVSKLPGKQ